MIGGNSVPYTAGVTKLLLGILVALLLTVSYSVGVGVG
jgi:hypothetical protein